MNQHEWPSGKKTARTYLDLNSVWQRMGDIDAGMSYYDRPPHIILRSMEEGRYWTGPIALMTQAKLDGATWLGEMQTAQYYVEHKMKWGYTSWYGVFKRLRSKEEILKHYIQVDMIDYEFPPDAPFSLDTRPNE